MHPKFTLTRLQVATALLVAGSTLTFWVPLFAPVLGCSHNCRRLTYDSFQLTHVTWWPHCSPGHGGQNEDNTLLQRSQPYHKGEFQQVSSNAWQRSLRCGQNLCGPFLRATLPMTVSVHDSDREDVVRIFVGLSCKLWGLLYYIILYYIILYYITKHNFSPTRSVIKWQPHSW